MVGDHVSRTGAGPIQQVGSSSLSYRERISKQNAAIGAQKEAEAHFTLIWWPPFWRNLTNASLQVVQSRELQYHG